MDDDPVAAWHAHATAVQQLLDDPAYAGRVLSNPHIGDVPLPEAVDRFYTADVFMHTWDLARATGQDETLDAETCAEMLAGMEPMDEMLRASGQYGPRVAVPDDADPQTKLIAFIGRDPALAARRRVGAHEDPGDRRRRLYRLDDGEGAGAGRAHARSSSTRCSPGRTLRAGPDLLRGRHRRPGLIRRIVDEHPDLDATIHMAARIVVPESVEKPYEYYKRQRRQVARALRRAQRRRQAAGALLLVGVALRDQGRASRSPRPTRSTRTRRTRGPSG